MGFITDIDLDINEGKVMSFTILGDSRNFFSRGAEEDVVFFSDILKVGCDTIIVNLGSDINLDEFNIDKLQKIIDKRNLGGRICSVLIVITKNQKQQTQDIQIVNQ